MERIANLLAKDEPIKDEDVYDILSHDGDDEEYDPSLDTTSMKDEKSNDEDNDKTSDSSSNGHDDASHEPSSDAPMAKESKTSDSWSEDDTVYENYELFEQAYRCFPMSHVKKEHLEDGNRIVMPPSALDRLASMDIQYPMVFEIKRPNSEHVSYCGVLEFSADEGFIFMPKWMMKNLKLQEGELVMLKTTSLPKGTYMKIQPHRTVFINLPDPKEVLEKALKDFCCVTTGDTIMITHNYNQYYIDIVETRPSNAISVVETDCEVDFAPPLDYMERRKKPEAVEPGKDCEKLTEERPKFQAFTGIARRLDGRLVTPAVSSLPPDHGPISANARPDLAAEEQFSGRMHNGKLVFGHEDGNHTPRVSEKVSKVEEKKFQPFTGNKYTLAG